MAEALKDNIVNLTEGQILMLQLSENDIRESKLITQEQLDINDMEWLKTND